MPHDDALYHWQARLATFLSGLSPAGRRWLAWASYSVALAGSAAVTAVAPNLAVALALPAATAMQLLRELYRPRPPQLRPAAAPGRRGCSAWPMALDATDLAGRLAVLAAMVLRDGGAAPVAWHVRHLNGSGSWTATWAAPLDALAAALGPGREVLALTDRGLEAPATVGRGRHPLMRAKAAGHSRPAGWHRGWPSDPRSRPPGPRFATTRQSGLFNFSGVGLFVANKMCLKCTCKNSIATIEKHELSRPCSGDRAMSMTLDARLEQTGTRFRIFPQPRYLDIFDEPEVVYVSVPPDQIQKGPADDRMFVVDAKNKLPYSLVFSPPYTGERFDPVAPGPTGHFDHLDPDADSRAFSSATMYATVRRVLDIWQDYFGHRVEWHFETDFGRLELIPLIEWDNAQSGYGFLEFGYGRKPNGGIDHSRPYCLNFDVLAHELGHSIIFSEVGVPSSPPGLDPAIDYGAMHESAGDLVAIVSSLHFNSVVESLLASTRGNLFTVNELDRIGELDKSREIRIAFNSLRMSDVGTEPHERSVPLTGGYFDLMVEVFQKTLVARGLISEELAARSTQGNDPRRDPDLEAVQAEFDSAFPGHEEEFKTALLEARDYLGRLLAKTWGGMNPDFLSFHDILRRTMRADRVLDPEGRGEHQQTIRECFAWREITPVPGSLLMRPHTLRECGLDATRTASRATTELEDGQALEELFRRIVREVTGRNGQKPRTARPKPDPARKPARPQP